MIDYVKTNKIKQKKPDCQTTSSFDYVFKINSDVGKMVYTTLLTAYTTEQKVNFRGTRDCVVLGSSGLKFEKLKTISLD